MRKLMVGVMLAVLSLAAPVWSTCPPSDTPVDKATLQGMTVQQLEQVGDECRAQKDYQQAITYFQEALRRNRKNAVLYNKLGLAELRNNQLSAARNDFAKAAKYDRKYPEPLNNIGAVDYVQKNYSSSAKYFKKAVALDETQATFHVNLGAAWFAQNRVDRAIAEYMRALELDPDALIKNSNAGIMAQISSVEERAKQDYMMAKVYARLGDLDRCLDCLKRAKGEGARDLAKVYEEEDFTRLWRDPRLADIVPPPPPK